MDYFFSVSRDDFVMVEQLKNLVFDNDGYFFPITQQLNCFLSQLFNWNFVMGSSFIVFGCGVFPKLSTEEVIQYNISNVIINNMLFSGSAYALFSRFTNQKEIFQMELIYNRIFDLIFYLWIMIYQKINELKWQQ